MSKGEYLQERYQLVTARIAQICEEDTVKEPFGDYFRKMAGFLNQMVALQKKIENGWLGQASMEEMAHENTNMYSDILAKNYASSYGNPQYASDRLGASYGQLLSFLYSELQGMIPYAFEGRIWDMTVIAELFVEIYHMFEESAPEVKEIKDALYWYVSDYSDEMVSTRIEESVNPKISFAADIIMNSDLADLRYLYHFGEFVSENELAVARFLNSLPMDEIASMAHTYTEGYRIGFINTGKDITRKKTVNIRYRLGFERMIKAAVLQFQKMGLTPVIYRHAAHSVNKRQHHRLGYCGGIPNKQYDYDHRGDAALYFDEAFVQRKLRVTQGAYEKVKELADVHGGPAVVEIFGETPFIPQNKDCALQLSKRQQELLVSYQNELGQITNRYIKGEERSFTIIAYPIPEIGSRFEEIFKETVKINTLDYQLYQTIQQAVIDALDAGREVWIKGCNGNETDLKVCLHILEEPKKQTNFENCVADVNIPVGEVFTTPVLKGTNGVLHVGQVYLNELCYKNLKLSFADGMVTDYDCTNFEEPAENKKFILENILYHHETLPMGEFAIGTNTTAYVAAKKYNIQDKLPILIAEKMGPHFAVGDTCYSWAEDTKVYNPDGKEIIARDNEISVLRKTDVSKAYLGCHTDITIPYEELEFIRVLHEDGTQVSVIENGRFVLKGTKVLNEPFENE